MYGTSRRSVLVLVGAAPRAQERASRGGGVVRATVCHGRSCAYGGLDGVGLCTCRRMGTRVWAGREPAVMSKQGTLSSVPAAAFHGGGFSRDGVVSADGILHAGRRRSVGAVAAQSVGTIARYCKGVR